MIQRSTTGVNVRETTNMTAASSNRNRIPCCSSGPISAYAFSPFRRAIRICVPMLNPNPIMKIAM